MLFKTIALQLIFLSTGTSFSPGSNTNYWIKQGDIAFNKQNIEESIVHYSRAIVERPKHALGYIKRAKAYRATGQFVKWSDDMQKAIELDPIYTKSFLESNENQDVIPR